MYLDRVSKLTLRKAWFVCKADTSKLLGSFNQYTAVPCWMFQSTSRAGQGRTGQAGQAVHAGQSGQAGQAGQAGHAG